MNFNQRLDNMPAVACTCKICGIQFAATADQDECGRPECKPMKSKGELLRDSVAFAVNHMTIPDHTYEYLVAVIKKYDDAS